MLYLLGVLILFLGICLSIALHEIGHLVPAKLFGVKTTQYMVGFGPTLWSTRRGETEYGLKAVPLGGYVRMIGMLPPRPGDEPGHLREASTGRWGQLIENAREEAQVEIEPQDEHRAFYRLSPWKKMVVMLGGPLMNLAIAFFVLLGVTVAHGIPEPAPSIGQIIECSVPNDEGTCEGQPQTAASASDLQDGDRFVRINGTEITSWEQASAFFQQNPEKPLDVVVERDGQQVPMRVTPQRRPVFDDAGNAVLNEDGTVATEDVGYLGFYPGRDYNRSISQAPVMWWDMTWGTAKVFVKFPQKLYDVAMLTIRGGERDPNGPISVVGVGRVAGEITSGSIAPEATWSDKAAILANLVAGLNIALFVFNLVPLMPLDGGHVAGALWEAIKKGWARLRNKPDPGYVDVAKGLPIAYAVSLVLIVMSVLLMYADIFNPVRLR